MRTTKAGPPGEPAFADFSDHLPVQARSGMPIRDVATADHHGQATEQLCAPALTLMALNAAATEEHSALPTP